MPTVKDIYNYLNERFPFDTQETWDNSGLMCGDFDSPVTNIILTLDVSRELIAKAAKSGCQLIIAHHPLVFSPVKSVIAGTALYEAVRNGISVISAHTCFDKGDGGTNDTLCDILGIGNTEKIGGDIMRLGTLDKELTVSELARRVFDRINCDAAYSGRTQKIRRVCVCTGAGGSEFREAIAAGADCLITGEMKYHDGLEAQAAGLAFITMGHYESEDIAMHRLKKEMAEVFPEIIFTNHTAAPLTTVLARK